MHSFKKVIAQTSLMLLLAVSSHAFAFGSIAINEQGRREGVSSDFPSQGAADRGALSECGGGCRVVARYSNSCAAISLAPDGAYAWDSGMSSHDEAAERARHLCRNASGGEHCHMRSLCDGVN